MQTVHQDHCKKLRDDLSTQETIKLIQEDCTSICDDSYQEFEDRQTLPPFYDEEKFKKGQEFYHKHVLAMFVAKLFGLLTVISTPTILKILTFTNMSSTPLTAYKRYLATVYHMCVWYDNDFKPGSKLWDSINKVKMMHCSASRRHCVAGGQRILQRDMGITQFGFMGFAILTPEKVGIHNATREELESFIHLWRVIGYIMGADDKYVSI
uniref:ER-bound oxygenase mpaB/mpaB'/Rubber oxygenase catalytic domain-containing protein n=2 Tax=Photinus pyralis TaxID=7054 RepID=A0A1Y1MAB2_PHOPY